MVGEGHAEQGRRADEQPVRVGMTCALSVGPQNQQQEQQRHKEQMERVRVGVKPDRPDARAHRESDADAHADDHAARHVGDGRTDDRARAGDEQRGEHVGS